MEHVFALLDPPKPRISVSATLTPGWTMPAAKCPACGTPCEPVAFFDLDSGGASLDCENPECLEDVVASVPWPFVEDRARPSDFRALGFRIV
jgi:hypothetical protein